MHQNQSNHFAVPRLGPALLFIVLSALPVLASTPGETVSLSTALRAALADNPALSSVRNKRESAKARVGEANSGFLPQLSLLAGFTQFQEPNVIVPIHEIGVFPPLDDQIYEASLQLRLPLFNGGRAMANKRASVASVKELQGQEEIVQTSLMEGVGQLFIQGKEVEDKKSLVVARIKSLRRRHQELALLLREGRVSPADVAIVTASLETSRADSIDIEGKKLEIAIRLGQLVGSSPVHPSLSLDTTMSIGETEVLDLQPDSSLTSAFGPRVVQAQSQLQRADALRSFAKRSFWPDINGFAGYNYRSGADLELIGEWAVGITLRLPLFEGGRRFASVRTAQASLRAAENNLQTVLQTQEAELQIAEERWRSARMRGQYISGAVASKMKSTTAYQQMYKAGRLSLSELLVQETELLQLQIQERSLLYLQTLALLHYHGTAGRLTENSVKLIVRSIL